MRKTVAAVLALLLSFCALAENAPFTLREGVAWGMTLPEVLAAEGNPLYISRRENGMEIVRIPDATHEGAPCTVEYLFFRDSLTMARVEYDASAVTLESLKDALSKHYGEATSLTGDQLREITFLEALPDSFYGWVLGTDTLVCLTENKEAGTLRILYSDLIDADG